MDIAIESAVHNSLQMNRARAGRPRRRPPARAARHKSRRRQLKICEYIVVYEDLSQ
jgi:hypothetical protein